MASEKISQLTQAVALTETDVLLGNHSSVTSQIPLSLLRSHLGALAVTSANNGSLLAVNSGAWTLE